MDFEKGAEQVQAFQKIWMESMSKLMQTAFTSGPGSPPPEILKQIRVGIFQALAQSWEEFMRSPQFTESMKQWMDNAINFRKMTNDFMGKVRNEMQAASRNDIDHVLLTVRHMEKRLLDRIDQLCADMEQKRKPASRKAQGNGGQKRKKTKASRK
jgi:hypothetical protein